MTDGTKTARIPGTLLISGGATFLALVALSSRPWLEPHLLGSRKWTCALLAASALVPFAARLFGKNILREYATAYFSLAAFLTFTALTPFSFSNFVWRQLDQATAFLEASGLQMTANPVFRRVIARNQKVVLTSSDYRFTFTTDRYGRRKTPSGAPDAPTRIAFLGASWTFGIGVNDEESFAYRTGELLGADYQTLNYGHVSWSLPQLLQRLQLLAREKGPAPQIVLVDWLPGYVRALYGEIPSEIPHYYFPANLPTPEQHRLAPDLEKRILLMIRDICRKQGSRLGVLLLTRDMAKFQSPDGHYREMRVFLESENIPFLDLSDIRDDAKPFMHDLHPGPGWHAVAAQVIAAQIKAGFPK